MGSVRAGSETGHAEVPAAGAALGCSVLVVMQSSGHKSVSKPPLWVMLSQDLCPCPSAGWDIQMWLEHRYFSPALCSACRKGRLDCARGDSALDQK